jgi:hypothetical protein
VRDVFLALATLYYVYEVPVLRGAERAEKVVKALEKR